MRYLISQHQQISDIHRNMHILMVRPAIQYHLISDFILHITEIHILALMQGFKNPMRILRLIHDCQHLIALLFFLNLHQKPLVVIRSIENHDFPRLIIVCIYTIKDERREENQDQLYQKVQ